MGYAGKGIIGDNGKLCLGANGKADICGDSCSTTCSNCSAGVTPRLIQVVISGVTVCDGCYVSGARSRDYSGFPNINGTYNCVVDKTTNCAACLSGIASGTMTDYETIDCTGAARIARISATYKLWVIFYNGIIGVFYNQRESGGASVGLGSYWRKNIASPYDCTATHTLYYLGTDACIEGAAHHGGTATISVIP